MHPYPQDRVHSTSHPGPVPTGRPPAGTITLLLLVQRLPASRLAARRYPRRGLLPPTSRLPRPSLRAPPALAATITLCRSTGPRARTTRGPARTRSPPPHRTSTPAHRHACASGLDPAAANPFPKWPRDSLVFSHPVERRGRASRCSGPDGPDSRIRLRLGYDLLRLENLSVWRTRSRRPTSPEERRLEVRIRKIPAALLPQPGSSVGLVAGAGFEPATFGL